jgi:aminoglycoside phosphotransferase family enzyme
MSQTQLPELIQALLDPKSYPHSPSKVELVQTQMSFVFLAGDLVYKVKKPVNLGYLDYTKLEQRHFFCQKEVDLNRRLCPEAYLGVVVIAGDAGRIFMEGNGPPIEYAVKMRHLPQDAMLNNLLVKDKATPQMLVSVAEKLARFHSKAETGTAISGFGDLDVIRQNAVENFEQTVKNISTTISPEQYTRIKTYTEDFLLQNAALFRRRVKEGIIRDCHGDLHAAHICFGDGSICIYDCIEFNDRFRYGDVASEVAFLAMDLDHYGRADLSRRFVSAYVAASGDAELGALLNFYKCYRAYVRGKVEGFKLADPHISNTEKTRILAVAREYFELADSYTVSEEVVN